MKIINQKTKTLITRNNGKSSDVINPNFIYGCYVGCMKSYCYVDRYNHDKVYINKNTENILKFITKWVSKQEWPKKPDQFDDKYYVVDIGCSTDVALMSNNYDWSKVFQYFEKFNKLKSKFATKYPIMNDVSS